MDVSRKILEEKASAILGVHTSSIKNYDMAYITNASFSKLNNTEFHKMEFTVVIIASGNEYRFSESVVHSPYTVSKVIDQSDKRVVS